MPRSLRLIFPMLLLALGVLCLISAARSILELKAPGEIKISVTGLDSPRLLYFSESFAFKTFFGSLYLIITGGCLVLAGLGLGLYFLLRPKPHQYQTLRPTN